MILKNIRGMHQAPAPQNMNQASVLSEFLKKLTQLILSLSVFSFFFLHPSWLYFIHSLLPLHNRIPSQLFSLATDKNYIFLLCNGIVVFVAKYSTRKIDPQQPPPPPELSPDNDTIFKEYAQMSPQLTVEKLVLVEYVTIEECEAENSSEASVAMTDEETENYQCLATDARQMKEVDDVISDEDEEEEEEYVKEEYKSGYCTEEEEEGNEEISMMSAEELNRRFEDFIRKMKEELRIEAQQQLIMV